MHSYLEVQKLIQIRMAHPALQSKGEITYVYAEENAYPLAYVRSSEEENILVVINPAARTVEFPYDGQIGEVLYQFGRGLSSDGKKITIQGQSVVFVKIS
ncbi:alpha-glucosidase C-terminal domain-containing protein [Lacrimispora saccharolytica]|nr:alpha-glucosidase C-terminal domain-containing protein [Lacrimispora saccharolytica]